MPRKRATDMADDIDSEQAIEVHLDTLLAERGMTLTELSELVGITLVNLSVLKNGHARAIRFSTLAAICDALECQPGDVLTWRGPGGRDNVIGSAPVRLPPESHGLRGREGLWRSGSPSVSPLEASPWVASGERLLETT